MKFSYLVHNNLDYKLYMHTENLSTEKIACTSNFDGRAKNERRAPMRIYMSACERVTLFVWSSLQFIPCLEE